MCDHIPFRNPVSHIFAQRMACLTQAALVLFELVSPASPVERLVLGVALAERKGKFRLGKFGPEIKGMRPVLLNAELGKQRQGVARDMMAIAIEYVHPILGNRYAKACVPHFRGNLAKLLRGGRKRRAIVHLEKPSIIALWQRGVLARCKHETARRIMFFDGAPRVRADLNGQNIANVEFRAKPDKDCRDTARIRLGQFGEVSGAHHHFGVWQAAPCFDITRKRVREPEVNWIEDRIDNIMNSKLLSLARGANEGVDVAMRSRHQYRHRTPGPCDIETVLVETKEKIRTRLRAA